MDDECFYDRYNGATRLVPGSHFSGGVPSGEVRGDEKRVHCWLGKDTPSMLLASTHPMDLGLGSSLTFTVH